MDASGWQRLVQPPQNRPSAPFAAAGSSRVGDAGAGEAPAGSGGSAASCVVLRSVCWRDRRAGDCMAGISAEDARRDLHATDLAQCQEPQANQQFNGDGKKYLGVPALSF